MVDHVANPVENDFSFPTASVIQFQYAARPDMPALDVFWYDGGMQPRIPELDSDNAPLPPGGMLYVGDKGKILDATGAPRLITAAGSKPLFEAAPQRGGTGGAGAARTPASAMTPSPANDAWVEAFHGGKRSPGDFLNAGPISETVCLAAVALRAGKSRSGVRTYPAPIKALYDSAAMTITNLPGANRFLTREYRQGWEL